MVLADVGLFDVIWMMLFITGLALFVGLVIFVVRDLFRDHELSGWAKVGWLVAVLIFPFLGSLVYLMVRWGAPAATGSSRIRWRGRTAPGPRSSARPAATPI